MSTNHRTCLRRKSTGAASHFTIVVKGERCLHHIFVRQEDTRKAKYFNVLYSHISISSLFLSPSPLLLFFQSFISISLSRVTSPFSSPFSLSHSFYLTSVIHLNRRYQRRVINDIDDLIQYSSRNLDIRVGKSACNYMVAPDALSLKLNDRNINVFSVNVFWKFVALSTPLPYLQVFSLHCSLICFISYIQSKK